MPNEDADYLLRKLQAREPGAARTAKIADKLTLGALPALYGAYKATTDTIGFASAPQKQYSTLYGTYNNLLQSFWHEKYEQRQKEAENLMTDLEKRYPKHTRQGEFIGTIGQGAAASALTGGAGLAGPGKMLGVGALGAGIATAEGSEHPVREGAEWAASEFLGQRVIAPIAKGLASNTAKFTKNLLPNAAKAKSNQIISWAKSLNAPKFRQDLGAGKAQLLKDAEYQVQQGRSTLFPADRIAKGEAEAAVAGRHMEAAEKSIGQEVFSGADVEDIAMSLEQQLGKMHGRPAGKAAADAFRKAKGVPIADEAKASVSTKNTTRWDAEGNPYETEVNTSRVRDKRTSNTNQTTTRTADGERSVIAEMQSRSKNLNEPPSMSYSGEELTTQRKTLTKMAPISEEAHAVRTAYNEKLYGRMTPANRALHEAANARYGQESRLLRTYGGEATADMSEGAKVLAALTSSGAQAVANKIPGGGRAARGIMETVSDSIPVLQQKAYKNILSLHSKYPGIFGAAGDALNTAIEAAEKTGGTAEPLLKALARIEKEYNSKTGYQSRQNKNQ